MEKEKSGVVQAPSPAAWMEVQEEEWQGPEEGWWGLKLAWLSLNSRGRWTQPAGPPDTSKGEDLGEGCLLPTFRRAGSFRNSEDGWHVLILSKEARRLLARHTHCGLPAVLAMGGFCATHQLLRQHGHRLPRPFCRVHLSGGERPAGRAHGPRPVCPVPSSWACHWGGKPQPPETLPLGEQPTSHQWPQNRGRLNAATMSSD